MDWIAAYHRLTELIVGLVGGSDKLAHVHAGLIIYVGAQIVLRTRRANGLALQAVLLAEVLNETADRLFWGSWRWADTAGDMAATLLWPSLLYALSRYRRSRWSSVQPAWATPPRAAGLQEG
ncbi:hypothetical protein [Sphingomonas nostoxanthinifaciens]|uniref:hypothetical protein n=1 Tax=Sphingomonas nostoxanthinifaciens TaxID=2872652 RepID=UPI001CC2100E|nr:hypothetical protein [Sphingomonas nostoxanthinifaciens]UAK24504.1 hypothetical protein K8P63_19735 [Sphingomonas nostoxanthinifaciens]